MKIILKRLDDAFHLEAVNEDGCKIETDGASKIGGSNKGMRPMQLLLAAAGSCSSIDIIMILKKQKQNLKDLEVEVTAERDQGKVPALFTNIRIHFKFFGEVLDEKAKRAVDLSIEKYCSVVRILEKTAKVSSSYEIIES